MPDATITIVGSIGQTPELKFAATGTAIVNFSVAVNRRYQKNGEWVDEDPSWFRVSAFGTLAENVAASVEKGNRVIVCGRPKIREYEKDGEKRSAFEVVADSVGPDLRWAQATVQRTERSDGGGSRGGTSGGKSFTSGAVYGDQEEPFARHAEIGDL